MGVDAEGLTTVAVKGAAEGRCGDCAGPGVPDMPLLPPAAGWP